MKVHEMKNVRLSLGACINNAQKIALDFHAFRSLRALNIFKV